MDNRNLDELLTMTAQNDLDHVMARIRAHTNGNGKSPAGAVASPHEPTPETSPLARAVEAQVELNRVLTETVTQLGHQLQRLEQELAVMRGETASAAPRAELELQAAALADIQRQLYELTQLLAVSDEQRQAQMHLLEDARTAIERSATNERERARLEQQLIQLNSVLQAFGKRVDAAAARAHALEQPIQQVQHDIAQLKTREIQEPNLDPLIERLDVLERKVEAVAELPAHWSALLQHQFDTIKVRLLRAERERASLAEREPQPAPPTAPQPATAPRPPFDYFMFEHHYRGTVASVKERQSNYVELFRSCEHVLDLGCGRGEFLQLLAENHIAATGVDASADMAGFARDQSLNVVHADLFEYLRNKNDEPVGGIFSAQVVEHLTPEQIREMLFLCAHQTRPGGIIVIETVNPHCPFALGNFWLDPTHVRPVPPQLLGFMLAEAGFQVESFRFSAPVRGSIVEPTLDITSEWSDSVSAYQDYAVIARRKEATPQ